MEKAKKVKLFIGLFYLILLGLFLYFFFSKFSLQEITSYEFIKNNREYFEELKQSNYYLLIVLFFIFTIFWVLVGGFGSPLGIFAGFIFGKWVGIILLIFGMSIGATGLYVFANFFLKEYVREKFLDKYQNLGKKFQKSEFLYLLIYRFVGGIPFAIANLLPIIFNVRFRNYFFGTFFGILPSLFIIASLGHGFEKTVQRNDQSISFIELILLPEIYVPIICFLLLMLISILARKIFYKN